MNFNKIKIILTDEKTLRIVVYCLIFYGILLRLRQFFFLRSFWLDEAAIAINIIRKSFLELAKPLDYYQVAPYGFLIIEKAFSSIFGNEDFVFRIFPLICGILLIFLFLSLLKNLHQQNFAIITGISLICLNFDLIYYTIELKPYIIDAFLTTLLIIIFLKLKNDFDKKILINSIFYSLIIWFSYPAILIIFGTYITFSVIFLLEKDFIKLRKLILSSFLPFLSFLIYYLLILKNSGQNEYIKNFWKDHFAPLPFSSSSIFWYKRAFLWAMERPFNIQNIYLGSLFTFLGTFGIYKKDKNLFIFLTVVFFTLICVSAIGRYPLYQRLLIFSTPIFYLVLLYSFEVFSNKLIKLIIFISFFIFLVFPLLKESPSILKFSMSKQEIKPALEYISENKLDEDLLAIHHSADTIFEFYKDRFSLNKMKLLRKIKPMWDQAEYKNVVEKIKKSKRVWLLFTDFRRQENELFLGYIDTIGIKKDEKFYPGVELYLYEIRQ